MKVELVPAFEIKDADTTLRADVVFDADDFSKPLDVRVSDLNGSAVTIPFDLFERFVAGVRKAADQ